MARIVIAGGTGFIGSLLASHFAAKGDMVTVLTRSPKTGTPNITMMKWDAKTLGDWVSSVDGCDTLINLTGKSVNCRYNQRNKTEILQSRLDATQILGEAIRTVIHPPKLWINAASATIYRHAEDHPQDEYTGEFGSGFSVNVCQAWEKAFQEQAVSATRKIALRIAIVLGKNGGVIPYYVNLAKYGLGGQQGNGRQYFSWIHEDDVIGIIDFLIKNEELEGTFNVSSPHPVKNYELMRTVRNVTGATIGLPATRWMLEIGTWLLNTETELILKSRWVLPKRLQDASYQFKVPFLKEALQNCITVNH